MEVRKVRPRQDSNASTSSESKLFWSHSGLTKPMSVTALLFAISQLGFMFTERRF